MELNEEYTIDKKEGIKTYAMGKVEEREMDYIEKALLQNQKALSATLSDIQNEYTTMLNNFLQNNSTLTNRLMALESQMHGVQVRLAKLSNGAATAE